MHYGMHKDTRNIIQNNQTRASRSQVSAVVPLLRLLLPSAALLFYCHYPDLLLAPSAATTAAARAAAAAKPGSAAAAASNNKDKSTAPAAPAPAARGGLKQKLVRLYRVPLDWWEQYGTGCASLVLVNSNFTRRVFAATFTQLSSRCAVDGVGLVLCFMHAAIHMCIPMYHTYMQLQPPLTTPHIL